MSVETLRYGGGPGSSANTDRNPSGSIWWGCPWTSLSRDGEGVTQLLEFASFNKTPPTTEGNWAAEVGLAMFSSTGGTATVGTGPGGELVLGSDDDNEGISFRTLATPFKIIRNTMGRFWFEARLKVSTIANTTFGFFLGLLENVALTATVPIAAAGTLSDNNFVGFHRLEGDGDYVDTVYKADGVTQVTVGTDAQVLVADTYVKLGMTYEPRADHRHGTTHTLTFWGNGLPLASYKQIPSAAGTDFPNDVQMGIVFALLNAAGSSPGTATIDWIRAAQEIQAA